jgi:hypothetical protein
MSVLECVGGCIILGDIIALCLLTTRARCQPHAFAGMSSPKLLGCQTNTVNIKGVGSVWPMTLLYNFDRLM